jgi:hypothetical protein
MSGRLPRPTAAARFVGRHLKWPNMNRAQEEELKRFTPTMWALLRYTAKHLPMAKIGGPWLRSARVLERRGFIIVCRCVGACYSMGLRPLVLKRWR